MLKGRNRNFIFFGLVFGIFVGSIIYFLFFAPGLAFEKLNSAEKQVVFLKNASNHIIRDVNILSLSGKLLFQITELQPGEKKELPAEISKINAALVAVAPFHASATENLFISGQSQANSKIKYELTYPESAVKGYPFTAALNLCNDGTTAEIKIEETHDEKSFKEPIQSKTIELKTGSCKKLDFALTPIVPGEIEILFNIKSVNFNEKVSKKVNVK